MAVEGKVEEGEIPADADKDASVNIVIDGPVEDVLEIKRGEDGQPVSKTARMDGGAPLARIMNSAPEVKTQGAIHHKSERKKEAKKTGVKRIQKDSLTDHARKYDVVSNISNASYGFMFGQMMRGDAVESKKEMSRLFTARTKKRWGWFSEHARTTGGVS